MSNVMDESNNKFRKENYLQYTTRNKALEASQNMDFEPTKRKWIKYPLILHTC